LTIVLFHQPWYIQLYLLHSWHSQSLIAHTIIIFVPLAMKWPLAQCILCHIHSLEKHLSIKILLMVSQHVSMEIWLLIKAFVAAFLIADEGLLSSVNPQMSLQIEV
jgi:hypothetical protein